jgi:secreted trypsin-like serine protease
VVIPAAAITWGELDTTHINVGAMVIFHPVHEIPWQTCSGTLVDPEVFLTAGHCTAHLEDLMGAGDLSIEEIWVNFDQDALNDGTKLDVVEVITHPEYDNFADPSNPHDVGVLILAQPVDIEPAVLPRVGFLDGLKKDGELRDRSKGAEFTVVGYGGTLDWPPPDIFYDDFRQVAESEYVALVPAQLHLSQHAVHDIGGTCFGDSGGPAFWTEEDGTEVLVGITSWGDAQCVATGFNYRVDIPDTLDFIEGVIAELE